MIIRRYINGKKVDIEVQTAPPPPAPPAPTAPPTNKPNQLPPTYVPPTTAAPKRKGCGCGRK